MSTSAEQALAAALAEAHPNLASAYGEIDAVDVVGHLNHAGWALHQVPDGTTFAYFDPADDPGLDDSPGGVLTHAVHSFIHGSHGVKVGTHVWGTLVADHLASLGWHLLYADPDPEHYQRAVVLEPDEKAVEVPLGGRAVVVRSDQDVVVFSNNNFDAELDALAAVVKVLEQFLEPAERSRIAIYLADRYTDAVTTEVDRPVADAGERTR